MINNVKNCQFWNPELNMFIDIYKTVTGVLISRWGIWLDGCVLKSMVAEFPEMWLTAHEAAGSVCVSVEQLRLSVGKPTACACWFPSDSILCIFVMWQYYQEYQSSLCLYCVLYGIRAVVELLLRVFSVSVLFTQSLQGSGPEQYWLPWKQSRQNWKSTAVWWQIQPSLYLQSTDNPLHLH